MPQRSSSTPVMFSFVPVLGASIGQAMSLAKAKGDRLPLVLKIYRKEKEEEKTLKRIIHKMTKYSPRGRPSMDDVVLQLESLQGKLNIVTAHKHT